MKKLILTILVVMISLCVYAEQGATTTGTTTSAYVTVYTIVLTANELQGGITLKNTGSDGNDVEFQVLGYMHADATEYTIIATADNLTDGNTVTININNAYRIIVVQVMYPAAGAASTYSCSHEFK